MSHPLLFTNKTFFKPHFCCKHSETLKYGNHFTKLKSGKGLLITPFKKYLSTANYIFTEVKITKIFFSFHLHVDLLKYSKLFRKSKTKCCFNYEATHFETYSNILRRYVNQIRDLLNRGAPVNGVGVQGHMGPEAIDLAKVEDSLNKFWTNFKFPIW